MFQVSGDRVPNEVAIVLHDEQLPPSDRGRVDRGADPLRPRNPHQGRQDRDHTRIFVSVR